MALWSRHKPRGDTDQPGESIRRHYRRRLQRHKRNWAVCHWADADTQRIRFEVFAANVELSGKRLLDVGCGLGDLWAFLGGDSSGVEYLGVDITPEIVSEGRRRHNGVNLVCADIFGDGHDAGMFSPGSFDVVFCSGAFNLDLGNNDRFLPRALARMFELARQTVAFNLLHKRCTPASGEFHPFEPADVLRMLRPLPCQARIIDDYLLNDFTVICTRK